MLYNSMMITLILLFCLLELILEAGTQFIHFQLQSEIAKKFVPIHNPLDYSKLRLFTYEINVYLLFTLQRAKYLS